MGITPAYAGKRSLFNNTGDIEQDHPRIRGKKKIVKLVPLLPPGSPPHTREKVSTVIGAIGGVGITPAYAGKSYAKLHNPIPHRDHPRIRGKKWKRLLKW